MNYRSLLKKLMEHYSKGDDATYEAYGSDVVFTPKEDAELKNLLKEINEDIRMDSTIVAFQWKGVTVLGYRVFEMNGVMTEYIWGIEKHDPDEIMAWTHEL